MSPAFNERFQPVGVETLWIICATCKCRDCRDALRTNRVSPYALVNDNFYGYALKLLVDRRVTWLECAAASLVWTTIMVYYLEEPYGHLMLENMEGPQARTQARTGPNSALVRRAAVRGHVASPSPRGRLLRNWPKYMERWGPALAD